jgi:hypothetical protein
MRMAAQGGRIGIDAVMSVRSFVSVGKPWLCGRRSGWRTCGRPSPMFTEEKESDGTSCARTGSPRSDEGEPDRLRGDLTSRAGGRHATWM